MKKYKHKALNLIFIIVDLLTLEAALESFDNHGLRAQNDKLITVSEMLTILGSIFDTLASQHPSLVHVPLCLDLSLNWLLNVYDRYKIIL